MKHLYAIGFALCALLLSTAAASDNVESENLHEFILEAGPIWNNTHAQTRCPEVLAEWQSENEHRTARWTGHWWTTEENEMSVCACEIIRPKPVSLTTLLAPRREIPAPAKLPLELKLINCTPLELLRPVPGAASFDASLPPEPPAAILPGRSTTVTLDNPGLLKTLVLDMGLVALEFDALPAFSGQSALTLSVGIDGETGEPFLSVPRADGGKPFRIAGNYKSTIPGDLENPVPFADVVSSTIGEIRRQAGDGEGGTNGDLPVAVDFAGEQWFARLEPDGIGGNAHGDRDAARITRATLRTLYDDEVLDCTVSALRDLGYRPLLLQRNDGGYGDEAMEVAEIIRFPQAACTDEEALKELVERMRKNRDGGLPVELVALLVTDHTFREAEAGKKPTPQPCLLLRCSNSRLLELRYFTDCSLLVETEG